MESKIDWKFEPYDCGLYPAVPPEKAENGEMSHVWIRDNYWIWRATDEDRMVDAFAQIVRDHEEKIRHAINGKATEDYMHIHPRYDKNLNEINGAWGWLQFDAVGNLYEVLALSNKESGKYQYELSLMRDYIKSVPMWKMKDNGMWEEEKDYRPSSYASILRGLRHDRKAESEWIYRKYHRAMMQYLPRKDLSVANCLYPINFLAEDRRMESIVLEDLEKLLGENGAIRYKGDGWDGIQHGAESEPEWVIGLAWMYMITGNQKYWLRLRKLKHFYEELPESFVSGEPNVNRPLLWSEAFFQIAQNKAEKKGEELVE